MFSVNILVCVSHHRSDQIVQQSPYSSYRAFALANRHRSVRQCQIDVRGPGKDLGKTQNRERGPFAHAICFTKENHIAHWPFEITISHLFHVHNATHTVTLLHLLKGSVDGRERFPVGDELIHLELTIEVVVHKSGELRATLDATKGTTLPHTTSDQLECYVLLATSSVSEGEKLTSCGNLLARGSNTNDDALTPTLVAGLKGGTHHTDVTGAVESIVAATVGHLDEVLLNGLAGELGRVHEVGGTELARPGLLAIIDINGDDLAGLVLDSTLHDGQTDTARTEDSDIGAFLDLGGHHGRTVTGGDTTAQQTGPVGRDLGSDRNDRDIGNNGVLGEGGGTHEVQDVLAAGLEAGGSVGHDTLTLSGTDLTAEVGLARLAELALTTFGSATHESESNTPHVGRSHILESDHIVARLHRGHTLTDRLNDTGTLVS